MLSAAILNGGRATRLGGRDKGSLLIGGRTIRDRQIAILSQLSDDVSLVGGDAPASYGAGVAARAVRWVPDTHPGLGPLAGIEVALGVARHPLVVILACDMPGVTTALLAQLAALASDANVDVVVPRTERGYHPLCAVYRAATCGPVVSARLAHGRLAVTTLFADLRVREVTGDELAATGDPRQLLANINTPVDHETLATPLTHDC